MFIFVFPDYFNRFMFNFQKKGAYKLQTCFYLILFYFKLTAILFVFKLFIFILFNKIGTPSQDACSLNLKKIKIYEFILLYKIHIGLL